MILQSLRTPPLLLSNCIGWPLILVLWERKNISRNNINNMDINIDKGKNKDGSDVSFVK